MPSRSRTRIAVLPLAGAIVLAPALLVAGPAVGLEYTVSTAAELNDAIAQANSNPGPDEIVLAADFTLGADITTTTEDLTITGGGFEIDADGFDGFDGSAIALTVTDLTIVDPVTGVEISGGTLIASGLTVTAPGSYGVQVSDGDVDITGLTVTDGSAEAVIVQNDLPAETHSVTIRNGSFTGNTADGLVLDQYGAGTVVLDALNSADNGDFGYQLAFGGTTLATLSDMTASGNPNYGVLVGVVDGARAELTDVDGDNGNGGGRVTVRDNGTLISRGSTPTGNVGAGWYIEAYGAGTTTTFENAIATDNDTAFAIHPEDDAVVTILDSVLTGGDYGIGVTPQLFSDPANGTIVATRVEVDGSDLHGVYVQSGVGSVDISLIESTIHGVDSGSGDGAAIQAQVVDATLLVERSTIYDNTSAEPAGGILAYGDGTGDLRIVDSTLSGNTSTTFASALRASGLAGVEILHSTIVDNPTSGDTSVVIEDVAATTIRNTVIDGGDRSLFVDPAETLAADYNLIGSADADTAAALAAGTGNITGSPDPMLGALGENGGPTPTMLPLLGSPLLNAGDPAFAAPPSTDQRGEARVSGVRTDIGAVEVQVTDPAAMPATGATTSWLLPVALGLLGLGLVAVAIVVFRRVRRGPASGRRALRDDDGDAA